MGVVTAVFQYANASPVANGTYQWKLSSDAIQFSTASNCTVPSIINGTLDSSGNMTSTFAFNDVLSTTAGAVTSYQLTVKAQNGGQVWNEVYYLTGSSANLNLIPPSGGIPVIPVTVTSTAATGGTAFTTSGIGGFTSLGGNWPSMGPGNTLGQINPGNNINLNEVDVWQFELQNTHAVRHATVICPSGAAFTSSFHVSVGIFSTDGNTKYVDSGTFLVVTNTAGTPLTNTVTAVTLTGGAYYFAQTTDSTISSSANGPQLLGYSGSGQPAAALTSIMNANGVRAGIASNTSSAGVLPSTLGGVTTVTGSSLTLRNLVFALFEP